MAVEAEIGRLLTRALGGDQGAWRVLVRGLSAMILGVARAYRLGDADALEVCQSTWCTLADRATGLREPARLPGWLITTARRHALRTLTARRRELLSPDLQTADTVPSPELAVLSAERDRLLWQAVALLPPRHRGLIRLLAGEPHLTHVELAARLGIRPGSVGPLRRRALDQLRRTLIAQGYDHA
jgi:RNA polymerase sigma factor (sigma-70 family)